MRRRARILVLALSVALLDGLSALAQAAGPLATPVTDDNLDPAALAQWVDGAEQAVTEKEGQQLLWTREHPPAWKGVRYGDSKSPGPRRLRIGFHRPVPVGALLVRGGGQVSVLRPDAAYPGNMADDSQWLPAERIVRQQVVRTEAGEEDYGVWVLPRTTTTRAIRFSHTPQQIDAKYSCFLGGACVLAQRVANVAPQAIIATSVANEAAGKLIDETNNRTWHAWDNGRTGGPHIVSPEHPVDVMLAWPRPVALCGLGALWAGFGAAEVQVLQTPDDRPAREAAEHDWHTLQSWDNVQNMYPAALGVNWLALDRPVTTRAVRVRITRVTKEGHPHLHGNTQEGRRVWLGELLALQPLGDAPLESAILRAAATAAAHPPIPVRFTLDRPACVTLVIEDAEGNRVRNLVSETRFPAGENVVWWDGTDDLGRDTDAPRHGVYRIPARLVRPGAYRVRGLAHPGIDVRYEFSVYSPGSPPWPTADQTGGWLTNHTPPSDALFVPGTQAHGGRPLVYLGSYVSEGGHGLAWVDLDGHKQGGVGHVGGAWTGAPYMARDAGEHAVPGVHVYVGSAWDGELRLTAVTAAGDKRVAKHSLPGGKADSIITGLAVHDGRMACSLPKQKQLLLVDAAAGRVLGAAPLDDPRGLAFDAQGRLLALVGRQLHRYRLPSPTEPVKLPPPEVLVAAGLEDPQHVACDAEGNFYITDRGGSHQVKVFDPAGKPLRTIGAPGASKAGPYDPNHMNNPNGLTIDERRQLWVAETDFQPKRVSVWTLDGRLVRAFYGPAEYGGGGVLDPLDKTRFYYHGMEFKLDWATGRDTLVRTLYRPQAGELGLPKGGHSDGQPQTPLYVPTPSGERRRYFTNCFNCNPTGGSPVVMLWLDRGDRVVPVAAMGRANDWALLCEEAFRPRWPEGVDLRGDRWKNPAFFAWSDLDGDGLVQPDEVAMIKAMSGGMTVMPDLAMVCARVDGRTMRFALRRFTATGTPVYDLAARQPLATDVQNPVSSGGDQALVDPSGWTAITLGVTPLAAQSLCGVFRGQPRWSYPSLWPGLHASHESPAPDRPGELIGTTRLLGGFVHPAGDAGPVWAINGNMGNIYLFTADGLFVAELFRDVRKGIAWGMPVAERGMLLNDVSLHDENFWPSITQTADGQVYVVDGARTSLCRVEGLERIRRLPSTPLKVSEDDLKRAQQYLVESESQRQKDEGRVTLVVPIRKTPPKVDGRMDDWADADWATIDRSGVAAFFNSHSQPYNVTAAVSIAGDRLYAAFRTADPRLLANSGEMPQAPFKTGGGLDLMLGPSGAADEQRAQPIEGDLRLLVTLLGGKPRALVYRPVVPGTKEPVAFSSPWRTITIDRVDDISDQLQFAAAEGDYEFSIPLAALGFQPRPGQIVRGDLGILRGNGFQTLHRVYWSNKATGITSDVPSEAALAPKLWGRWRLKEQ